MKRYITIIALLAFCVAGAQAQIVGATNGSSLGSDNTRSTYRQKGGYLKIEAGQPVSLAYDYQFNSYVAVGCGAGFQFDDILIDGDEAVLVFSEFTASTPLQKAGLFANVKLGLGVCRSHSFPYGSASIGGSLGNFKLGVGVQNGVDIRYYTDCDVAYSKFGITLYLSYSLPLRKLF